MIATQGDLASRRVRGGGAVGLADRRSDPRGVPAQGRVGRSAGTERGSRETGRPRPLERRTRLIVRTGLGSQGLAPSVQRLLRRLRRPGSRPLDLPALRFRRRGHPRLRKTCRARHPRRSCGRVLRRLRRHRTPPTPNAGDVRAPGDRDLAGPEGHAAPPWRAARGGYGIGFVRGSRRTLASLHTFSRFLAHLWLAWQTSAGATSSPHAPASHSRRKVACWSSARFAVRGPRTVLRGRRCAYSPRLGWVHGAVAGVEPAGVPVGGEVPQGGQVHHVALRVPVRPATVDAPG